MACIGQGLGIFFEIGKEMVNVVSAYVPQVGCDKGEKEEFWRTMDEKVNDTPRNERIFVGVGVIGHVGEGNAGDDWEQEMMKEKLQYSLQQGSGWHFLTPISGRKGNTKQHIKVGAISSKLTTYYVERTTCEKWVIARCYMVTVWSSNIERWSPGLNW